MKKTFFSTNLDSQKGIIKLLFIIIIGIIILSYLNVDAEAIVSSQIFQKLAELFTNFWK